MSDWSMYYELDGTLWDEVGESDGTIVPRTAIQLGNKFSGKGFFRERNDDGKSLSKDGMQRREGSCCPSVNDLTTPMLEKNSWSSSLDGECLYSGNTNLVKEISSLVYTDARMSNNYLQSNNTSSSGNELCGDIIYGSGEAAAYNSLRRFQLGDISSTGNNLNYFADDNEDKDCINLSYYGWPDIGNFEEVDRILRSCDSTFGQENSTYENENSTYENENSWFSSSSHAIDGYEDYKTGINSSIPQFNSTLNHGERSAQVMFNSLATTNFDEQNILDTSRVKSNTLSADDSATRGHYYRDLLDIDVEDMMVSVSEQARGLSGGVEINITPITATSSECGGMINLGKKQSNNEHQSEGKREDQSSEYLNDSSFHCPVTTRHFENMSSNSSMKSQAMTTKEKIEKVHQHQQMQATLATTSQQENSVVKQGQAAFIDQVPVNKQLHRSHDIEVERASVKVRAEVDSSTVQESSSVSTMLDDVSLEASSLRHLRCVMKQLDIRTKLCIRDSLFRLAKSAEQRHNLGYLNSSGRDSRDERGLFKTEEANESSRFADLEAYTNQIDRSVAHLLFQSLSDPFTRPGNDSLSLESCIVIQGSIGNWHLMPNNLLYKGEVSDGVEGVAGC